MSTNPAGNAAKQLFYKITQVRSTIGMPPRTRKNIEALGLKRRNQIIYQKVSAATAHRLSLVKELVKIDLVDTPKTKEEINKDRKFNPGFELIKNPKKVYQ